MKQNRYKSKNSNEEDSFEINQHTHGLNRGGIYEHDDYIQGEQQINLEESIAFSTSRNRQSTQNQNEFEIQATEENNGFETSRNLISNRNHPSQQQKPKKSDLIEYQDNLVFQKHFENLEIRKKPGRRKVWIFKIDERGTLSGCKMGLIGLLVLSIAAWILDMSYESNRYEQIDTYLNGIKDWK